jgi:hypothetical protein
VQGGTVGVRCGAELVWVPIGLCKLASLKIINGCSSFGLDFDGPDNCMD